MSALVPLHDPHDLGAQIVTSQINTIILASVFFTVFFLLDLVAIIILLHKGVRVRRAVQIQFACTVALLISTSGFYTLSIAFNQGSLLSELGGEIDPQKELTLVYLEQGVMTVLLSINIFISDAVVWWRAYVVWNRNVLILFLGATVTTTTLVCGFVSSLSLLVNPDTSGSDGSAADAFPGNTLYQHNGAGSAALALSLASNMIVMLLIAYKAWRHRQLLYKQLGSGYRGTNTTKVLSLLVESGTIYSLFWLVVLVSNMVSGEKPAGEEVFFNNFSVFTNSCLAPLVGSYPLIIIILVAVNGWIAERGLPTVLLSFHGPAVGEPYDSTDLGTAKTV